MSGLFSQKTGVLLINLGTPEAPTTSAVRRYLAEFLSDPRVIDLPRVLRYILLYCFILPFRSKYSAKLYQKIWTPQGSPLLLHTQALCIEVKKQLDSEFVVVLGMRYGNPSITSALKYLDEQSCQRLIIFPLFPQCSSATTGSALKKVQDILDRQNYKIPLKVQEHFFDAPAYIDSLFFLIQENLLGTRPDHFIFSYHGLPKRHLKPIACAGSRCDGSADCPVNVCANRACYRAQCFITSHLLAERLHLSRENYSVTFQSRMRGTIWIQPYTDCQLILLAKRGIKKLMIVCPSFVADCLETLEEIGLRAQAQWQSLGGESLQLIPALNTHPFWVKALRNHIIELSRSL